MRSSTQDCIKGCSPSRRKTEGDDVLNIKIYQINLGRDGKRIAFQGLAERERISGSKEIDSKIYDCVFEGDVECKGLEEVFGVFNLEHPEGHKGRSLSVSDIVEVPEGEEVAPGFYYCDNVGFKQVEFDPEKAEPLKEERIRVLMVEPGKKAYEKEIGTSLDDIYRALECDCFQNFYPYEDLVVIVCDDEGKINGSRPNRAIYDGNGRMVDVICGKFFICDCSTDSFKSLPDDMMEMSSKYAVPLFLEYTQRTLTFFTAFVGITTPDVNCHSPRISGSKWTYLISAVSSV